MSSIPRLMIIVSSTRPVRVGRTVADWFHAQAEAHGGFDVDFVDLAELNLPFMDEPNHPRLATYTKQHTLDWSARVDAADAFVFVMAEYNHGYTAALKNAIDYLLREWAYKPVGFVSYGGVAGGTRAVQAIKPVCVVIKMWPLVRGCLHPLGCEAHRGRRLHSDGGFRDAGHGDAQRAPARDRGAGAAAGTEASALSAARAASLCSCCHGVPTDAPNAFIKASWGSARSSLDGK